MADPTPPQLDAFLGGLKQVESGGNYDERNGQGAYQILQSNWPTWAKRYAGYITTDPNASDAPPAVQDEVARGAVTADYYGAGQRDYVKVAEIWNGGEPYPVPNPALGPGATTADYAARVMAAMGAAAPVAASDVGGTSGPVNSGQLTGNDWLTALDNALNPDIGGASLNPFKDASEVGKMVELVGTRISFALVGLVLFGGGLLLAFGRDIFGGTLIGRASQTVADGAEKVTPAHPADSVPVAPDRRIGPEREAA